MADMTQTAANVLGAANKKTRKLTAGATIVAGDMVYEDGVNGAKLAKGDVVATADAVGMALNGGADNQPIEVQYGGDINPGGTVVVGETYVLSAANAGKIAPVGDLASTNSPTIFGLGTTTSNIQMSINVSGILKP